MNLTPKRYPTAESARQNWLQWSGSLRSNNGTPSGSSSPSKVTDKEALPSLESMFPDWDPRDLQQMLVDNQNNTASTIDAIFKMDGPPRPKAVSSQTATAAVTATGFSAWESLSDWDVPLLGKLNNYGENGTKKGIRGEDVGPLLRGYANLLQWIPDTDTPVPTPYSQSLSTTHYTLCQHTLTPHTICTSSTAYQHTHSTPPQHTHFHTSGTTHLIVLRPSPSPCPLS